MCDVLNDGEDVVASSGVEFCIMYMIISTKQSILHVRIWYLCSARLGSFSRLFRPLLQLLFHLLFVSGQINGGSFIFSAI